MITYRDAVKEVVTATQLHRLLRFAGRGDTTALLLEAGELEQGVIDALHPACDGWGDVEAQLRALTRTAADAYCDGRTTGPHLQMALRGAGAALEGLARRTLPSSIRITAPEGFAHYALDPAGYVAAARRYASEAGPARPMRAIVIGVRSIGTTLSALVAAALGTVRTVTVRPRGEPGARRIAADRNLEMRLGRWLEDAAADVLIVDEGPGATGETFRCVARWLAELGAEPQRIALVPSHAGGLGLAPTERRAWFAAARRYPVPAGDVRAARIASRLGLSEPENLSAGGWRAVVPGSETAPVYRGHERLKYRAYDRNGIGHLIRYAGLGRWGAAAVARAARLADIGIGPPVIACADGFLVCRWISGSATGAQAGDRSRFRAALQAYLAARAGHFRTGRPTDVASIVPVLLENAREALGPRVPGLAAALRRLDRLPPREAVIADARLQAREWICGTDGYAKTDAVDHGDGVRFPGPGDGAWDIAGAAVEYGLADSALAELIDRCAAAAGDGRAALTAASAAYRAPYAACCLGEAALAAREAPTDEDRQRLAAEAARYRAALAQELRRGC